MATTLKDAVKKQIMKKPKLGTGDRFAQLKEKLAAQDGENPKDKVRDPAALAAFIGRKKFGNSKFQSLARGGKK